MEWRALDCGFDRRKVRRGEERKRSVGLCAKCRIRTIGSKQHPYRHERPHRRRVLIEVEGEEDTSRRQLGGDGLIITGNLSSRTHSFGGICVCVGGLVSLDQSASSSSTWP